MRRSTPARSLALFRAAAAVLGVALVVPASADSPAPPSPREPDPLPSTIEEPRQGWLEAHGISIGLASKADILSRVRGGISDSSAARYRGHLDLVTALDTKGLGLWFGGAIVLVAQNGHGRGVSESDVGDVQALSNIDARSFTQMSEWFLEQALFEGRLRLKVGRQDAAADFGLVDFGAEFLNSSFGVIPTSPLPTFPDPALGVSAFADLTGELSIGVGVYASTPASWGRIRGRTFGGEVGFAPRSGDARSSTKYRAGFWYQRHPADPGAPGVLSVYAALDQVLFREGKGAEGLSGFLQLGTSTGAPNGVSDYLGAGLVYTGLLPGRNEDRVGLGVAHARLPAGTDGGPTETAIELLYRVRPWRWLTLQPSVHWLLRPGGQGRNAIVAGLRIETGF